MSALCRLPTTLLRVYCGPKLRTVTPIFGNPARTLFSNRKNVPKTEFVRLHSEINRQGRKIAVTKATAIKDKNITWKNISKEEWRTRLTYEEYEVTRNKATEIPFTGKHYNNYAEGVYLCTCCSQPLFSSKAKYDSGSGWPSFNAVVENTNRDEAGQVTLKTDTSFGMIRTEILCGKLVCCTCNGLKGEGRKEELGGLTSRKSC
ncbi:peptide methionine sulfoxide reductase MsrB-like isoform X2 [Ischnura elegans]|uniref:peptide methionine sulfoxide reductase MsrB-like isoform X2 n=1 Tax=Ischnura elegans TaxID=197161 RepID=UPI001ED8B373|nr:peptide methionine sulfoxide reductase MsrB-like isoform X2 [Ischnura elegans]